MKKIRTGAGTRPVGRHGAERQCGHAGHKALALALALTFAAGTGAFGGDDAHRILSEDGTTLTFSAATDEIWTNTVPIETTVTTIVKEGAGDVCLVPQTNTTFTGEITIRAGFFSGLQKSFGKPSKLTIENGGALVFLDLLPGSYGVGYFPLWNTAFFIEGDGPDHCGAIQRPVTHCDHVINGFCKKMTLTGDTMINCGSRWGFAGTTLDMNNHTLTFSAKKHTYPGSATKWSSTWSPIFQFARNGDLLISNPGAVRCVDGARLLIESNAKVLDAAPSNGTVSNMTVTITSGCQFRPFGLNAASAPVFKVSMENTSILNINTRSNLDGPVEVVGGKMQITNYEQNKYPPLTLRGGLSAPDATVENPKNDSVSISLLGAHTNEIRNLLLQGRGGMTVADQSEIVMSNVWVGSDSSARPARLNVRDASRILCRKDLGRVAKMDIGGIQSSTAAYGILDVSGSTVVSNALAVGHYGYGALYQDGGEVHILETPLAPRSQNNAYIGLYGYGYVGVDGGLFRQGYWCNLGGYDAGRGFIVQRGGRIEHWDYWDPMRMCFSGDRAYANIAQLGGTSVWKGYLAMGFNNYTPTGYGSTCTLTVSGVDTLMDMSGSQGIYMVPSTNAHRKAWTGNVNLNDGGTLKVKNICKRLVNGGSATPAWSTLDQTLVKQATKPYLNFNGGVLKTAAAGEFFMSSTEDSSHELERVTVYEKGAIIDTDGKDVTWRMPFQRPYGHGLKRVTLPEEVTSAAATNLLIGPTRCYITSAAGGFAGDLLMDFSNAVRRVMGVLVTCPGCGYEEAPTVTFEKANCSSTDLWACTVETVDFDAADYPHGGLVKRGAGTLTVTAANTYGGATRLEGGTLALAAEGGLPSGSALEFAASALGADAEKTVPLLTATAYNGGEVRITEADTLDKATFGRARVLARFDTPLTALPPLKMVASDGSTITDVVWGLSLSSDGKTLKFGAMRGLLLILR